MFLTDPLEVAIGLVFVYLLLSLIVTSVREAAENLLKRRAEYMRQAIGELLDVDTAKSAEDNLVHCLFVHPHIFSLYKGASPFQAKASGPSQPLTTTQKKALPSYIPAENFVNALLDIAADPHKLYTDVPVKDFSIDRLKVTANDIQNDQARQALLFALNTAQGDMAQVRQSLTNWYTSAMDRVTGWYKRESQQLIFWGSLVACIILNVNSAVIGQALYKDTTLRRVVVAEAGQYQAQAKAGNAACSSSSSSSTTTAIAPASQAAVAGVDDNASGTDMSSAANSTSAPDNTASASPDLSDTASNLACYNDKLVAMNLPLGWNANTLGIMANQLGLASTDMPLELNKDTLGVMARQLPRDWWKVLVGIVIISAGWLITAYAMTLGAPFWFDVLNKIMALRSSVKPDDTPPQSTATAVAAPPATPPAVPTVPAPAPYVPAGDDEAVLDALDPMTRPRDESVLP